METIAQQKTTVNKRGQREKCKDLLIYARAQLSFPMKENVNAVARVLCFECWYYAVLRLWIMHGIPFCDSP